MENEAVPRSSRSPRSWIAKRERELEELEEEVATLEGLMGQQNVKIADCEEEIAFIEKLQEEDVPLCHPESGERLLDEMKGSLEWTRIGLEGTKSELEIKVIECQNRRMYVKLAKQEHEKIK